MKIEIYLTDRLTEDAAETKDNADQDAIQTENAAEAENAAETQDSTEAENAADIQDAVQTEDAAEIQNSD